MMQNECVVHMLSGHGSLLAQHVGKARNVLQTWACLFVRCVIRNFSCGCVEEYSRHWCMSALAFDRKSRQARHQLTPVDQYTACTNLLDTQDGTCV